MAEFLSVGDVDRASSAELLSIHINRLHKGDPALIAAVEAELSSRGLPLPEPYPPAAEAPPPPMTRETFLSYLFLIYTVTGLVYSWLYLPMRLIKGDFRVDTRHKVIQSGIALAYQAAEVVAIGALLELPL
jgi:hypothetical protein